MNNYVSTHRSNDDLRHFQFVRNSGLPRDTFAGRRITADQVVYVVCILAGIVAALFIPH